MSEPDSPTPSIDNLEDAEIGKLAPQKAFEMLSAYSDNMGSLRKLTEQIQKSGIIPFVGAGISAPFGMPGWKRFLEGEAAKCGQATEVAVLLAENQYEEAAELLLEGRGHAAFHDAIDDAFGNHKFEGKPLHGAVAHLPRLAQGSVITTNYDRILEKVFETQSTPFEEVVWGAKVDLVAQAGQGKRLYLLKMHGDVKDSTERILTLSDYQEHYGEPVDMQKRLPRSLSFMMQNRPLLFVGCSLDTDRTMTVLGQVFDQNRGLRHYAILSRPKSDTEFYAKAKALSNRGIRPIWFPPGKYAWLERLLAYLADLMPEIVKKKPEHSSDARLKHIHGFFGREQEVAKVLEYLEDQSTGIATVVASEEIYAITGAGGLGKSEICKEALRQYLVKQPEKPLAYVELSGASTKAAFLSILARELGAEEIEPQILHRLAQVLPILYLDNLEDLTEDVASIAFLQELKHIAGIKILASSRTRLPSITRSIPIGKLGIVAAKQLFQQEWMRSLGSTLEDSDELTAFLNEELDGHPLSIVLVAAQAYQYPSLSKLRAAWKKNASELAQIPYVTPTPRTSLDISLSLSLSTVQREKPEAESLWLLMAFFSEGMIPSAWQILQEKFEEADALKDTLIRLSIVQYDGREVLQMLAPLRQFILEKSDKTAIQKRSLDAYQYFFGIAYAASSSRNDPQNHISTLDLVLEEFPNIHSFILYTAQLGKGWSQHLSELSSCLANFYQFKLLLGYEILNCLLPIQKMHQLVISTAITYEYLGDLESWLGQVDAALNCYQQAITLFQQERDNLGLANTLRSLGNLECRIGQVDAALNHYQQAIELSQQERDNLGLANTLKSLGDLERRIGQVDAALNRYQQAITLFQQERDNLGLANALQGLGNLESQLGQVDAALNYYQQSITLYQQEKNNLGLANALKGVGDLERERSNFELARSLYLEARNHYINERAMTGLACTSAELVRVSKALGSDQEAQQYLNEALEAAMATNTPQVGGYVAGVIQECYPEIWEEMTRQNPEE
jgi:tetratricopeptide (TPR) repeat protein